MNSREKTYTVIIIILLAVLIVKSIMLDNYSPANKDEELFYSYANRVAESQYDGFMYKSNIASFKVVSITKESDEGVSVLEIIDPLTDEKELVEIEGKYKAKVRKYLLWIIPYGEDKILSRK